MNLSRQEKLIFQEGLATELSKAVSISLSRMKLIERHQISTTPQGVQILLSFSISATEDPFEPSVAHIIKDLNIMIINKPFTTISFQKNAYMLDAEYGFKRTRKLYMCVFFFYE